MGVISGQYDIWLPIFIIFSKERTEQGPLKDRPQWTKMVYDMPSTVKTDAAKKKMKQFLETLTLLPFHMQPDAMFVQAKDGFNESIQGVSTVFPW